MMTIATPTRSHAAPPVRAVLITGAARRIGRLLAIEMARSGWAVAVHYRHSRSDADELIRELRAGGAQAAAFAQDLSETDRLEPLLQTVERTLGPVQCLINNASEFRLDTISSLTEVSWDTHLDINLKAPVFLAQAMARRLPEDMTGNVINIVDQRVWNLSPDFFSYTVSKAGLWTVTRTLAQALAPRIRVNAIGPGPTFQSIHQSAEDFAAEAQSTLLKCGPQPEEIVKAVRFLLETPSITGQMIALDGGQHLA